MPQTLRARQQFGIGTITPRNTRRIKKHAIKSSGQEIASLLCLPGEILLDIAQYVNLPDLEALSLTCKYFYNVFHESLSNDQRFAREKLRDITLATDGNYYGYHDLLLGIVRREINPNYIKRFDCRAACLSPGPFGNSYVEEGDQIEVARYIGWTPEDISLIRSTIVRSLWFENIITPDELIHKMLQDDEDAVLALLVPLMKNLYFFLPPHNAVLLQQVFVKIARAQIMAELTNPPLWQQMPLRRLHTLVAIGSYEGMTLGEATHYMSLPSVRRVFLNYWPYYGPEQHFTYAGSGIPRSRASNVYMRAGVWRNEAEAFANHLEGPCIIRQYMEEPIPNEVEAQEPWVALQFRENGLIPKDPMSFYWDHCIITPGQVKDFTSPTAKNWAGHGSTGLDGRSVEFAIKYRAFHYAPHTHPGQDNSDEYEAEIRQTGIVASPQWLALFRWNWSQAHPEELDDDNFALED